MDNFIDFDDDGFLPIASNRGQDFDDFTHDPIADISDHEEDTRQVPETHEDLTDDQTAELDDNDGDRSIGKIDEEHGEIDDNDGDRSIGKIDEEHGESDDKDNDEQSKQDGQNEQREQDEQSEQDEQDEQSKCPDTNAEVNSEGNWNCKQGMTMVLVRDEETGCSTFICQIDPLYKPTKSNRGAVIGGSCAAVIGVLLIIILILVMRSRKAKKKEKDIYKKDTINLISELSVHDTPINSTTDISNVKIGPDGSFDIIRPQPHECGTELTMDIAERPPEKDDTITILADGTSPYRRENTASVYPMIGYYSGPKNASPPFLNTGTRTNSNSSSTNLVVRNHSQTLPQPHQALQMPVLSARDSPGKAEAKFTKKYEEARRSGMAALQAVEDASVRNFTFNPFTTSPNLRGYNVSTHTKSQPNSRRPSNNS